MDIDDTEGYYRFVWKSKEEEQQKLLSDLMTFAITGADYFNETFPDLANNEEINTNPDVNYLPYIELINGASFNYAYNLTDNWATTLSTSTNHINGFSLISNPSNYSFYNKNWNNNAQWNNSSYTGSYVARMNNNNYQLNESYTLEPVSLYINQVNNGYQVTTSTFVYKPLLHGNSYGDSYTCGFTYDSNQAKITSFTGRTLSTPNVTYQYSGSSLEDCFKNIAMRWRNVNIYVNGTPWSIVTSPPEPVSIGGQGYITDTQVPFRYDVPEGTYWNPNILKSILRQLLDIENNTNGVVKWIDIEDAFTDEYGVQALWTISVVRTDYDVLIQEQYPIGTIPNKDKGLRLPQEQISGYTDEMIYITKVAGSDMIPSDILTILGACGVIILIAYLINRMLE